MCAVRYGKIPSSHCRCLLRWAKLMMAECGRVVARPSSAACLWVALHHADRRCGGAAHRRRIHLGASHHGSLSEHCDCEPFRSAAGAGQSSGVGPVRRCSGRGGAHRGRCRGIRRGAAALSGRAARPGGAGRALSRRAARHRAAGGHQPAAGGGGAALPGQAEGGSRPAARCRVGPGRPRPAELSGGRQADERRPGLDAGAGQCGDGPAEGSAGCDPVRASSGLRRRLPPIERPADGGQREATTSSSNRPSRRSSMCRPTIRRRSSTTPT